MWENHMFTPIVVDIAMIQKGNWTSWSVANNGVEFTVTRTFEYYSDEEVKVAIAEMELAKSK